MKYLSDLISSNMVKKLIFLISLNFLIFQSLHSANWRPNDWKLKVGETISGEFKGSSKMTFTIGEGEWTLIDRSFDDVYADIFAEELLFVQFDGNVPIKYFNIGRVDNLGKWIAYISTYIQAAIFNEKDALCRLRQHYNYIKFYKKGMAHNCMVVTITDVNRELYPSDYNSNSDYSASVRRWIKKNNIKMPEIYLEYSASFHAMTVRPAWYLISYGETPETFANYKSKYTSRDTTEFHPDKIDNFPKAKAVMEDWLKTSAKFQKNFENFLKVRKHQKLDLNDIAPKITNVNYSNKKKDITDQILKLNELYKSRIITKEEFEKAKAKILR